ncbi:MAG: hypothetical protein KJN70_05320 [Eudoraea sp.]|nr:hypothetical protein [Eudoraea sp.]
MNDFLNFFMVLLIKPKLFFKEHFLRKTNIHENFALVFFGLGLGLDRMDRQYIKLDLRGKTEVLDTLNSWPFYWMIAIIGGAVVGYIAFMIGGWFYNVRIKWSRGSGDLTKSRNLYLFSNFWLFTTIVVISFINFFLYDLPYDPFASYPIFDILSAMLILIAIFYSVYISYSGVRAITDAQKGLAILWFIVVPVIYYLFSFSALIWLLFSFF